MRSFSKMCVPISSKRIQKNIAVVFFSDDGEAHTHYFGTCYPAEVGQMAWQLNADACLTLTQANAGLILEAAEQEDEDGEPEEN